MTVVVVESPAKAKTINAYLGKDYTVLASYGHVRDLPSKDGSVDPDDGFAMKWETDPKSQKHLRDIADALANDGNLILATDPDREGEAISWHLLEALRKRRAVKKDTQVSRVVFNAITKSAITQAMQTPRQIDSALVDAYLARRALDYLVGFTLSPVLWRKLPGARSAGRVQSVALRLIVEREMEIEAFRAREYWSVKALLTTPAGDIFEARLVTLDGKKLDRYDLADEAAAKAAVAAVQAAALRVVSVEAKPQSRNPAPPFMTSTLQQEASRKLGFGAQQTMRTAQRLYEAGHITYMRTDGIDMAPEAVAATRSTIVQRYGDSYLPAKPRVYKNKAKNAQEAHEAIRPTRMEAAPGAIRLESDQARLYELIWKRAIASQMEAARFRRTTVEIADETGRTGLRATGQVVTFDGFRKVYEEGRDDVADDDERRLPEIPEGADLQTGAVTPEQHFTQPPPRYTEATLVKRMEELGIGRPSTYASIITTIQDRDYVRKDKNRLIPEDKGRLVTIFLENYFSKYVAYDFTADLEAELDEISAGRIDWKNVLDGFWRDFSAHVDETKDLRIGEVLDRLTDALAPHLFPEHAEGGDPRLCPSCGQGRLSLKTARSGGAFIGCPNYPECRYTRPLGGELEGVDAEMAGDGRLLGHDPAGVPVLLKTGRFGPYVQLGKEEPDASEKPKRSSLTPGMTPDEVTLEIGLALLSLPREIGTHPEDGEQIQAGLGRYGPYVKHGRIYASLEKGDDVLSVGMNRAMELLARKAQRGGRGAAQAPLRALGEHPDGGPVAVMDGRYGPYVKWEKINATLPKDSDPQAITLEEALVLIAEKAAKKPGRKKPATKKPVTKKTAAKKPAAKKAAPGKAAAKATGARKAPAKAAAKKSAAEK